MMETVITPYQVVVPLFCFLMVLYAWNLVMRQKKTIWEAILWTLFWGAVASIALFPNLLTYLTIATGIKSQENAVVVTALCILSFLIFYIIVRLEELEQRQTRMVRALALRELSSHKKESHDSEKSLIR